MKLTDMSVARKLRFHQLMVFDQVIRSGSMLRAAEILNLTQPAVSKIVHELEAYFDGSLLVRGNRGVVATELGTLVLTRGKSLLAELHALTDEVNDFQSGTSGHVVVGTLISASTTLLPTAIRLLKQIAPGIAVSLRVGQMDQLFPALAVGELDLVVSRVPDDWQWRDESSALKVEVLYEEMLNVVAGNEHALNNNGPVTLADMHEFPWVLPTRESLFRRTVDRLFAEAGLPTPVNVVESLSILTNLSLLEDQQTIGFMPSETAQRFVGTGMLSQFDLGGPLRFGDIGCFSSVSRHPGPAVRRFRECLDIASQAPAG